MGDHLLVGAAVLRVPFEGGQLGLVHAGVGDEGLVVEDGDGVEVLGQAVALTVLAHPQVSQARLVDVGLHSVRGEGFVQRDELTLSDELRVFRQVVGEHVGRGAGHEAVGHTVKAAEAKGVDLPQLTLEELRAFCPQVENDVFSVLTVAGSLASRNHIGGTAPEQVRAAIARARQRL